MMPGSGLRSFKMVEKEVNLVDPFFDSDEDEVPVDMAIVFEAMKHVPLPDLDYPEHDDPIAGDASLAEPLSGTAVRARPNVVVPQSILKRKGGPVEMGQPRKKAGGTGRVSKRFKVEVQNTDVRSKTSPKQAPKVEIAVGSVTAVAAKVAAEVPPNVVTGGIVAETGPRPDFSLWTVDDDLLLKNAMEAGAAMEALAKGAMRFSRRFTVRELRERWRALLYDPEISAQAAVRMVAAEYGTDYSRPKSPIEQKSPLELARKRRANSVRTLYYKRIKKVAHENVEADNTHHLVGGGPEGVLIGPSTQSGSDVFVEPEIRPVPNVLSMEMVDSGCVSPKEAPPLDSEDGTFSQMFSLLAAGGVRAVVGDIRAGTTADVPEQDISVAVVDVQRRVNDLPSAGALLEFMGSRQEPGVLMGESGLLPQSGSLVEVPREPESAKAHIAACMAMDTNPTNLRHVDQSLEEGSTFTAADIGVDVNLIPSSKSLKHFSLEAGSNIDCPKEGNCKSCNCTGGHVIITESQINESSRTSNGDCEDLSPGLCPISSNPSDPRGISGTSLPSEPRLMGERRCLPATDDKVDIDMDDADGVDGFCTRCDCEVPCVACGIEGRGDDCIYDETEIGDQFYVDDEYDDFLPSMPTGKSGTPDLGCVYGKGGCHDNFAPSFLGPYVCVLNTQDMEIPSLENALLSSPSLPSSPSEQGEYHGCTDGPFANADGYPDNYVKGDVDENADGDAYDEYVQCSPMQGVSSTRAEPDNIDNFCDPVTDPTVLGLSVDKSGGKLVKKSFKNFELPRGPVPGPVDGTRGLKNANLSSHSVVSTFADAVPDHRVPCVVSKTGVLHQQLLSQVDGDGILQAADGFGISNLQKSTVPNLYSGQLQMAGALEGEIGNLEREILPARVSPTPMLLSDSKLTTGEAHKLAQDLGKEDLDSEEEMPRFSDIEAMILDMDLDVADDGFSARAESRRMYRRHGRAFVRAEQSATAAMQRTLNARGALATLYGRHQKYYMTQTEVLMGRGTTHNTVDIDLGREGRANKVSRQQASIKLKDDGVFYLRNLGRRILTVNNKSVETGERAILGSDCLIEVGSMRFIFETNRKLVKEHVLKRHQPE